MKYTAIFEKGPTSWGGYIPDLPGVIAAAPTREEVEALIREAVQLQIRTLREQHQPIPEPASFAGDVEIP